MRFVLWAVVACGCAVIARCLEAGNQEPDTWMADEEDAYFLDSMDSDTWPDHLSNTDNEGDPVENPQIDSTTPVTSGSNSVVASHLNDLQLSASENNTTSNNVTLGERLPGTDNNSAPNNLSLAEKLPGSDTNTTTNNITMGDRIKKFMGFNNSTNPSKQESPTEQTAPQGQEVSGANMTSAPRVLSQNTTPWSAQHGKHEGLKDLKVPLEYMKSYEPKGLKNRNTSQTSIPGKSVIPGDSQAPGNKSLESPKVQETKKEENTSSIQPPSELAAGNTTYAFPVNNNLPEESKIPRKNDLAFPVDGEVDSQFSTMNKSELANMMGMGMGGMVVNNITIFENITIPRNVTVFKGIDIENKNGTPDVKNGSHPKHEVHPTTHKGEHPKHKAPVPSVPPGTEIPVPASHPEPEVPVPAPHPKPEVPVAVPHSKHKTPVPEEHSKPEEQVSGSHPKPEVPFLASHPGIKALTPGSHPSPEGSKANKTSAAYGWVPPPPLPPLPPVASHKAKNTSYPHAARYTTLGNTSSGFTSVAEGTDTVIVPHNLTVIVNSKKGK